MHTLVLTGELTHRSAPTLEVEMDRRCAEGVSGITLDLRGLTHIDSIGVAVIAFRSRLLERRGYGFAIIAGPPAVQLAFDEVGLLDVLPFQGATVPETPPQPTAETAPERHLRAVV